MKLSGVALFVLFSFLIVPFVHAEIAWETKKLVFHPSVEDKEVAGEYKFTNSGSTPVTILSAEPGCDCISNEFEKDKKTYQPGETGALKVKFNCGSRTGLKQKTILVTTDDKTQPKTELTMMLYLPESPTIKPSFVCWNTHEAPSAKSVTITIGKDCPFCQFREIKPSDSRIHAELKTVESCKEYVLSISVDKTRDEYHGYVDLISDIPAAEPRKFRVHACVMNDK